MVKSSHEIRDPIHGFIRLDSSERLVLDSEPFQRLRHIHQLALSYLVYPGATHRRFEHSLGVMELAGRVFDVVTHPDNVHEKIKDLIPELREHEVGYWRNVLRIAALCHDIGHLPFSHAAEKDLLPDGWKHERLTKELILSDHMKPIWDKVNPPVRIEHIAKLAVGPKYFREAPFTDWEAILSEIIVGDAFGVDRIDYLLRDSHHAGVAYGKFDHYRLIDTLRILPREAGDSQEPALGVEEGGLHAAEALLLARYFMYTQVYFHRIRRSYDIHLKDFLVEWLPDGKFPTSLDEHLKTTDNEIMAGIRAAARDSSLPGHDHARRIVCREHFRVAYERNPGDIKLHPEPGRVLYAAAQEKFGKQNIRWDKYVQEGGAPDFPVLCGDKRISSSLIMSDALTNLPVVAVDYLFISPAKHKEAEIWLKENREATLRQFAAGED